MRGIKGLLVIGIVGALGVTLGAAPTPADNVASQAFVRKRVIVKDNFFEPRSVSIHRGDRVTWIWRGENPHNVTFTKVPKDASKRGATTTDAGRFSRRFRKRGLYKYICTVHAGMRGLIDVEYQESLIP
jgi:plastocyanin